MWFEVNQISMRVCKTVTHIPRALNLLFFFDASFPSAGKGLKNASLAEARFGRPLL